MSSDLFKPAFWQATLERAITGAAAAVTTGALVIDDWGKTGLMALGAFAFSILKALAAYRITDGSGPSLTPKAEVNANLAPFTEDTAS